MMILDHILSDIIEYKRRVNERSGREETFFLFDLILWFMDGNLMQFVLQIEKSSFSWNVDDFSKYFLFVDKARVCKNCQ